jgi:excisionase family DNA binding protein
MFRLPGEDKKLLRTNHPANLITDLQQIELPAPVIEVPEKTLSFMAQGKDVAIIPQTAEMTARQVARVPRVSRPFAVKLPQNEEIPFRKTSGKHRRVLLEDVIAHKEQMDQPRLTIPEKLTAAAQKPGLGY